MNIKSDLLRGKQVTVALSGGADSVALLHALHSGGAGMAREISAVHVNHNLRGEESARDEAFVRDLCAQRGVKLHVYSVEINREKHRGLEEAARNARYGIFSRFDCVATGHTASDNAETVLLNLIRGTGLKGLCGIPHERDNIVRPLILCERAEIEEYCRVHGLRYVTDSSNLSDEFTRNRVRMSLIPVIKDINPAFDGAVTRMCEILREDSDSLEQRAVDCDDYSLDCLRNLEKPVLTRIIMRLLAYNNISPSNLRISQIVGIIEDGKGKINLEKHKFALIEGGILQIKTIPQSYR
jgi:tRNA(Ile)-lysidine synthase